MDFFRSIKLRRASSQGSQKSRRYRASVHLIPTPGIEAYRPEQYNTWPLSAWKVLGLAVLMIVIGIATEIALALSNRNQGFPVKSENIFAFAHVQTSFLTSFFPTMFVFPLCYLWNMADLVLRWYQPYIVLSQGNARAEDSLMLDYIMGNRVVSLFRTLKKREWIIHLSIATALATNLYQPLAGALLSVKLVPKTQPATMTGSTALGLSPDFTTLNAFLAAAGFTEAAAFQGLPDPPFVRAGWAAAQFNLPGNVGSGSSVAAETTGIRTSANCENPVSLNLETSNAANFSIIAKRADGCTATVHFSPDSAEQQYGTGATDPVSCGLSVSTGQQFVPVMFWFYHNNTADTPQGKPQASAVICRPSLDLFNIVATVDLTNGSLVDVQIKNTYTAPNNVSGSPLDGQVFNAVVFGDLANQNDFVKARATAVSSQIPGAIFRFASQNDSVLQNTFNSPTGFLDLTSQIYTQHLSVTAKTVYFVTQTEAVHGQQTSPVERLIVDNLAGHSLAVLLIVIGLIGIAVHLGHRHLRRKLYLTAHPGTIASIVALTSHSGFGELLYPFDDKHTIRRKLSKLRFSLDRRTGAIVADELEFDAPANASERGVDEYAEKLELSRIGSSTDLLTATSKPTLSEYPAQSSSSVAELGYEHEPLVYEPSRSRSMSPAMR